MFSNIHDGGRISEAIWVSPRHCAFLLTLIYLFGLLLCWLPHTPNTKHHFLCLRYHDILRLHLELLVSTPRCWTYARLTRITTAAVMATATTTEAATVLGIHGHDGSSSASSSSVHSSSSSSSREYTKASLVANVTLTPLSCISARRRRRMGYQPYRGTGWAAGRPPPGHGAATYNQQPYYASQQPGYQPPPPTYGASQDYYGGRDVELQSPPQAYGGYNRENVYSPPPGPPPQKNDGIIR